MTNVLRSEVIQQQINDLRAYLEGLPEQHKIGAIGQTYAARLELLYAELAEQKLSEAAAEARVSRMRSRSSSK